MSEVKVNKITPRTDCGTTQLGDSGDTVTVTGDLRSDSLKAADGGVIISQSGTTITVGASGDTVSLASGASQSGFGRAGTVDWQTTIKTGDFTAASGEGYFIDTSSGEVTITLPSSPSAGDIVALKDYANTFDSNKLNINRNGQPLSGGTTNASITTEGQALTLVYGDSTKGWQPVYAAKESDFSKATFITATGGNTVNTVGDHKVHIFTGPGTFTVCSVGNAAGSNTVIATVVAGGAGGGSRHGGGGGAGGMTVGQAIPVTATGFPISVGGGGGGAPGPGSRSSAGSNSTGLSFTGVGGGQAGSQGPVPSGQPGGSGGGAGVGGIGPAGPNPGGSATQPGQSQPPVSAFNAGNAGGAGGANPGPDDGGGGGGGATAAGVPSSAPANPGTFSRGGAGKDVSPLVNGAPGYPNCATYAGGGGGGGNSNPTGGAGGAGGGGNGGPPGSPGNAGTANTGGGGGASGVSTQAGGAGGSGIVIIEYKFQ